MILIVCLDKRNGMRFNNRRQSCDRCVTDRIIQMSHGKKLYISPDSTSLFPNVACVVSEHMLELAKPDDICFLENANVLPQPEKIQRLIVFRWDKVYPSDMKFPMDRFAMTLSLKSMDTFPGHSHDSITQEEYW